MSGAGTGSPARGPAADRRVGTTSEDGRGDGFLGQFQGRSGCQRPGGYVGQALVGTGGERISTGERATNGITEGGEHGGLDRFEFALQIVESAQASRGLQCHG